MALTHEEISRIIPEHRDLIAQVPGFVRSRPGYAFENGWITDKPAIVLKVEGVVSEEMKAAADRVAAAAGVPVRLAPATPQDYAARDPALLAETLPAGRFRSLGDPNALDLPGETPEIRTHSPEAFLGYEAPEDLKLDPVDLAGSDSILCHVSPEQGWPVLKDFLAHAEEGLTVGMYDFTAPHIVDQIVETLGEGSRQLRLILDPKVALTGDTKAEDITEDELRERLEGALEDRCRFAWGAVTVAGKVTDSLFPTAYHIKVAVRDGKEFWLSSGNWQSSNQPNLEDPAIAESDLHRLYNREWHVIVANANLAAQYEGFLKWDYDCAEKVQATQEAAVSALELFPDLVPLDAFEAEAAGAVVDFPVQRFMGAIRVQPLLTPDNYHEHILELIEGAQQRLYLQNQYIKITKTTDPTFMELVNAVKRKAREIEDVRIILRAGFGSADMLEALQKNKFPLEKVKLQNNCHNKGIIVDSSIVAVGSHNWSAQGTSLNRDASLIIYDERIAGYFEKVFLHDWDNLAQKNTRERAVVRRKDHRELAGASSAWTEFFD